MTSTALANSMAFWLALIGGLIALYVLAVIIGLVRHVECLALVVIFNCFPIAWHAALVTACMMPRKEPVMAFSPYYRCEPPGQW